MIRALRIGLLAIGLVTLAIGLVTSAAAAAPTTGQQYIRVHGSFAQTTKNTIPTELADEDRFPREDPKEVDAVQYINNLVNQTMTYVTDKDHYGVDDLWVQAPRDLKGDCEDFALTKMFLLGQMDLADVSNSRIEEVVVHWTDAEGVRHIDGHAIMAYQFGNGSVAYLDINYPNLMTKMELMHRGYEFQKW